MRDAHVVGAWREGRNSSQIKGKLGKILHDLYSHCETQTANILKMLRTKKSEALVPRFAMIVLPELVVCVCVRIDNINYKKDFFSVLEPFQLVTSSPC